jgi:hypothetical protein
MSRPSPICAGMPPDLYHAHPAICPDGLAQIARSPLHYQSWRSQTLPESDFHIFHTALCLLLLAPERFDECIEIGCTPDAHVRPSGRRLSITAQRYATLAAVTRSINEHKGIAPLLEGKNRVEPVYLWMDAETGVACRARASWQCADGSLVRIVTAQSAHPDDFRRHAEAQRQDVACGALMEGYRTITGIAPPRCLLVAVETLPPYAACLYEAGPQFLAQGIARYRSELSLYAAALISGRWDGYGEETWIL